MLLKQLAEYVILLAQVLTLLPQRVQLSYYVLWHLDPLGQFVVHCLQLANIITRLLQNSTFALQHQFNVQCNKKSYNNSELPVHTRASIHQVVLTGNNQDQWHSEAGKVTAGLAKSTGRLLLGLSLMSPVVCMSSKPEISMGSSRDTGYKLQWRQSWCVSHSLNHICNKTSTSTKDKYHAILIHIYCPIGPRHLYFTTYLTNNQSSTLEQQLQLGV